MQDANASEIGAAWDRIRTRLSSLAEAGVIARRAVELGDGRALRAQVHTMRGLRAALARDQRRAPEIPNTPAGVELLAMLGPLRQHAMEATQIADIWLRRELPDEATLRQTPEGYLTLAERLLPAVWDVEIDLVALIGPGGEAMADALAAYGQRRIIMYVPEGFDAPQALPPQAVVVRSQAELGEVGRLLASRMPERMVAWRTGPETSPQAFGAIREQIQQALAAATVERNTLETFGDLWLKQALANVPAIASLPPFAANGQLAGVPIVVVAPGPSLAKNVHLLRELQDRAVIATFSHTLSTLRAAGVRPHLVIAADMEDLRYHFEGTDLTEVEALALAYTVHPDLYGLGAKRTFSFSSNRADAWLSELLGEEAHVENGGSVAHMAFSMGVALGCSPIVLVGQDLSFPDGRVYCEDNVDGETRAALSEDGESMVLGGWSRGYAQMQSVGGASESAAQRVVRVPAAEGGEVITSTVFAMFRQWFIDQAMRLEDSPTVLLNCTEGGARIDGMEHLPLRDAIDRYMTAPVDVAAGFDALATGERPIRRVLSNLMDARAAVRKCHTATKRGLSVIKKLERGHGRMERLTEAERALSAAIGSARFLSLFAQKELAAVGAAGRDANSLQDNLASTRALFRAVQKAADAIAPRLDRAIAVLQAEEKRCA